MERGTVNRYMFTRLQIGPAVFLCLLQYAIAAQSLPASIHSHANYGLEKRTLEVRGIVREYFLFRPSRAGRKRLPLVLAFHGSGFTGSDMARISGMNDAANRRGVLLAYPSGITKHWADSRATSPALIEQGENDIDFLRAIIAALVRADRADPARVYATGVCNGGFMAMTVGCRMGDQVAAIAAAASTMPASLDSSKTCRLSHPMPMLLTLGTLDPFVPWGGGPNVGGGEFAGAALSVSDTLHFWARMNHCRAASQTTKLPVKVNDGTEVMKESYGGCRRGSDVMFYSVIGGGHTWPGGEQYAPEQMIGKTTQNVNASETILDFFLRFRL